MIRNRSNWGKVALFMLRKIIMWGRKEKELLAALWVREGAIKWLAEVMFVQCMLATNYTVQRFFRYTKNIATYVRICTLSFMLSLDHLFLWIQYLHNNLCIPQHLCWLPNWNCYWHCKFRHFHKILAVDLYYLRFRCRRM